MKLRKTFLSLLPLLFLSEWVFAEESHCPTPQDINTFLKKNQKSMRFGEYEFTFQELGESPRVLKFIKKNTGTTKIECSYRVRERENNRRVVHTRKLTAPVSH